MTTRPTQVATPESGSDVDRTSTGTTPTSIAQFELTVLHCRIAALETALECERERRKAVVERYERLLDER
ncbi:hypothetical protein NDI85_14230 [Halomicroarcula sp. S1AR25-4]|uniref:hypothetical protein n=1 Tax=Haloarcula sp. S1AR25-4 TaxID=2950538 RepID=UPI002874BB15|nr:hypothetical protein [Halomicroarcula sp. S1AR25-4]MDS0278955.1 hypothetical protein [Halomicroarcula sp. S1AR25-4]